MVEIDEALRLDALHELKLLDTMPSESFDRITRMASQIFGLPVSAISLTDSDRQWFKSRVGVDHTSIPREKAPCGQVADTREFLVINDLAKSGFYADSPLGRNGTRFYAGAPLVTREGFGLGSLCVLGREPREITQAEVTSLKDLAAMVMAQIELQHAFGRVDPVSGLPNRNQFLDDLADLVNDGGGGERIAVLVDLISPEQAGDFMRVMGPGRVDDLVRRAVSGLRSIVGPDRAIYHVGSTQFALLAPPGSAFVDYVSEIEAVRGGTRAQIGGLDNSAVGIVIFLPGEKTPHDVLRALHSACQDARASPGFVSMYSPDSDHIYLRRFQLLEDFGAALCSPDQLRLVYQPRMRLSTEECGGAETLLRWSHPLLGNIPPDDFIPTIEQSPHVSALTTFVIGTAIKQMRDWREAGMSMTVSVNISAANLGDAGFVDMIAAALEHHGVDAEWLELEVTESAVMQNAPVALARLQELSDMGIRIAIDDFGTGHSSLAYLQKLPANVVKIDRSFVTQMDQNERDQTLVRSMISMSHELGFSVVAEGVETANTATLLRGMGCEEAQGYYFARPLEAADFADWYRRSAR